jgi:hypothetical protein
MPTEFFHSGDALFLLAHPDDEFGCFEAIRRTVESGHRAIIVFLTNDARRPDTRARREAESRRVLARLGVDPQCILFVGGQLDIPDSKLHNHLAVAWQGLQAIFQAEQTISTVYVPAWEGGHHDHDAVHALGVLATEVWAPNAAAYQFPLYNSFRIAHPFFRVLYPLSSNGHLTRIRISFRHRLQYIGLCMNYPSQWKTWVGLLPFVAPKLLFTGAYTVQPTDRKRLFERPHLGSLFYERRGWLSWDVFEANLKNLISVIRRQMDTTVEHIEKKAPPA